MAWFRHHYGAGPLHLLALLACFALTGYVVTRVLEGPEAVRIFVWFVAAALAHDLVLWPLYTLADGTAVGWARRHPEHLPRVSWVNYVRVPVVISAITLSISFPLVFRLSEATYHAASGLTEDPYLGRWLLVTGVAFGTSAVLYAVRLGSATRKLQGKRSDHRGHQPGPEE